MSAPAVSVPQRPTSATRPRGGLRAAARRPGALVLAIVTAGLGVQVLLPGTASAAAACTPTGGFNNCVVFSGTNGTQLFTVPKGVDLLDASLAGSGGGASTYDGPAGGAGGLATGTLTVTGGQTLSVVVGTPTFGGGGAAGVGVRGTAGTGGGLSAIWAGDSFTGTPLILAGGGGGSGGAGGNNPSGGAGGGTVGGDGNARSGPQFGGHGGTQTAGGAGGQDGGTAGSQYQGGNGTDGADSGGGGGAGWYGGGGGHGQIDEGDDNNDGGGGGGSGYLDPSVTGGALTAGAGSSAGLDGSVVLQWTAPAPVIDEPADGTTTGSTPAISGTGVPGTELVVSVDATEITCAETPVTISTSGDWTCTPTAPLTVGSHSLTATQTDPATPLSVYPASEPNTVTVAVVTAPSVPLGLTVVPGDGSVEVTFDEPESDGGSPVTGYEFSLDGVNWQAFPTPGASPYTFTIATLTNGTAYTVQVRAVNAFSAGPAATAEPVTPVGAPTVPQNLSVVAGDGAIEVTFGEPASDGGSPLTGYEFSLDDGVTWQDLPTTGTSPYTVTIADLTNGTTYTVQVRAVNEIGAGPAAVSEPVTPVALAAPSVPLDLAVVAGDGSLYVTFDAPADDGGAEVTAYEFSLDGETWVPRSVAGDGPYSVTVTGLTNGTAYVVQVRAVNEIGAGPAAASDPVTPVAPATSTPTTPTTTTTTTTTYTAYAAVGASGGSDLAYTGVPAVPTLLASAALLILGGALLLATRRRTAVRSH